MIVDVLFEAQVDIPKAVHSMDAEQREYIESGAAKYEGWSNVDCVLASNIQVGGKYLHRASMTDLAHMDAFFVKVAEHMPGVTPVKLYVGTMEGLPIGKKYTVDDQTGAESIVDIPPVKDENGDDIPWPVYPVSAHLTDYLEKARAVDDGEGGTVTIPAKTDFNKIFFRQRIF